eukprot:3359983-Karenia_brevis.AAC.1
MQIPACVKGTTNIVIYVPFLHSRASNRFDDVELKDYAMHSHICPGVHKLFSAHTLPNLPASTMFSGPPESSQKGYRSEGKKGGGKYNEKSSKGGKGKKGKSQGSEWTQWTGKGNSYNQWTPQSSWGEEEWQEQTVLENGEEVEKFVGRLQNKDNIVYKFHRPFPQPDGSVLYSDGDDKALLSKQGLRATISPKNSEISRRPAFGWSMFAAACRRMRESFMDEEAEANRSSLREFFST